MPYVLSVNIIDMAYYKSREPKKKFKQPTEHLNDSNKY